MNRFLILASILFPLGSLCVVETDLANNRKGSTYAPVAALRSYLHERKPSDGTKPPIIVDGSHMLQNSPSN